eukprot:scaffold7044_cov216-Pinguiococcus_pyrenoidosus.AAC.5
MSTGGRGSHKMSCYAQGNNLYFQNRSFKGSRGQPRKLTFGPNNGVSYRTPRGRGYVHTRCRNPKIGQSSYQMRFKQLVGANKARQVREADGLIENADRVMRQRPSYAPSKTRRRKSNSRRRKSNSKSRRRKPAPASSLRRGRRTRRAPQRLGQS